MKPPLGFVLVTHALPGQALRLCRRLNVMFGEPPIAVHHDFGKAALNTAEFPANVRFVERWVTTGWGTIGVVDALLAALGLLYGGAAEGWGDPDWFISLSGADYPIQSAETILRDLAAAEVDGFLDCREITDADRSFHAGRPGGDFPFAEPRFREIAYRRYMATPLLSYMTARRLNLVSERYSLAWPLLVRRWTPFHDGVRCYAGDAWMTMSRRAARVLLEDSPLRRTLHRHYQSRVFPEESIYQTLLCNAPGIRLRNDNLRYTDWRGQHQHPRSLGTADVPLLMRSGKHFARKFPDDADLLEQVDRAVEEKSRRAEPESLPEISVVIPSYNCGRFLPRAIESALAQTVPGVEVIVVDDGSTDDTAEVVRPYLSRIHYIHQANKGLPGARNTGIRASQSEFVALLDADDAWLPEKLARQMPRFADPAVDIVYSDFRVEYSDGTVKDSYLAERPLACEGDVTEAYIRSRFLFPSSMVLRRKALEASGVFDESMLACEDVELFTKMTLRGKVAWVNEPLMIRTEGAYNLTANGDRLQNYLIRAHHALLGNVAMPASTRRVLREELGLNYFYRGYKRYQAGQMGPARRDLLKAMRYRPEIRVKALRVLLATLLPASWRG